MRRVVIHRPGGYDKLVLETAPDPSPGPGEVQIAVEAIGVNYADVIVRMGLYASASEFVGWPITPGFEVAGTIAALGDGVTDLRAGDPVIAVTRFGAYASQLVVPRHQVFARPAGLDAAHGAAIPTVFMTAWFALHELAHPRPGAHVLIHSAAGGVGSALIQLAKLRGCVTAGVVGRSNKVAVARELGCDHVIDKSTQNLWHEAKHIAPQGYDVVLDANGVATLGDSYKALRRAGKLVVYGFSSMMPKTGGKPNYLKLAADWLRTPRFNPLDLTNDSKSILAFNLSYLFDRNDLMDAGMRDIATWLADGKVKPPPVATYPLADVARAHADIESGRTVGKLVLIP
jgi:NADPH:quinone reductase-like Zn-dependent oxidoreductase